MRVLAWVICALPATACAVDETALRLRHGSPLYTHVCEGGRTFQSRQVMSGEVEVTAGRQTRDVTDADGEPVPDGPRLESVDGATRLTGMPGGPYEACVIDLEGAE